jgi:hypothetical protein
VRGKRNHSDSRRVPKSVPESRFRSRDDARDVEIIRVYECELNDCRIKTSEALTSEVFIH